MQNLHVRLWETTAAIFTERKRILDENIHFAFPSFHSRVFAFNANSQTRNGNKRPPCCLCLFSFVCVHVYYLLFSILINISGHITVFMVY